MKRINQRALWGLGLLFALSTITACTFSAAGGIAGGLGAALLALSLFVGVVGVGTQSGCDGITGPCLSIAPPDASPGDAGTDAYIGPCLSAPYDAGVDAPIGPCLGPPLPDAGLDAYIGPCLTTAPADASTSSLIDPPQTERMKQRSSAFENLKDRLPADVVARLKKTDDRTT